MVSFEERMSALLKGHSISDLSKAYQELSKRYHQLNYKPGFQSALEVKAYAAARMPATMAVVTSLFSRFFNGFHPETVLDLGAGTGAASLASLLSLPSIRSLTLVEQDQFALQVAKDLLDANSRVNLTFQYQNLKDCEFKEAVDLILLSYVLNELPEEFQQSILGKLLASQSRFILIIMPGTPICYKQMMKLREFAIQSGYYIQAPCPHQLACPLELVKGDWCHFSIRLPRTRRHQQFKEALLNFEDEKYCYLLLSKEALPSQGDRIIKRPIHRSGHSIIDICKEGQTKRIVITRKDKDLYRKAVKAEWGESLYPTKVS